MRAERCAQQRKRGFAGAQEKSAVEGEDAGAQMAAVGDYLDQLASQTDRMPAGAGCRVHDTEEEQHRNPLHEQETD